MRGIVDKVYPAGEDLGAGPTSYGRCVRVRWRRALAAADVPWDWMVVESDRLRMGDRVDLVRLPGGGFDVKDDRRALVGRNPPVAR